MKARLIPLYLRSVRDREFDTQVGVLRKLLEPVAEIGFINLIYNLVRYEQIVRLQLLPLRDEPTKRNRATGVL